MTVDGSATFDTETPMSLSAPHRRGPFLPGDRIVIADDSAVTRLCLKKMFQSLGAERLVEIDDGAGLIAALNQADASDIRLLVLDVVMPRANGLSILKDLRCGRFQADRQLPVFLVTSCDDEATQRAARTLHADAILPKPFRLSDLGTASTLICLLGRDPAVGSTDYGAVELPSEDWTGAKAEQSVATN